MRGYHVRTPYGWGLCIGDDPDRAHLQVALEWRLCAPQKKRVPCAVRRADVLATSFCATGDCVLTIFGTGVALAFRPEDSAHCVQLWGPLGAGRHSAYLQQSALLRVLPAAAGLAVETPLGKGICRGYEPGRGREGDKSQEGRLVVELSWGRAYMKPDARIRCPVAAVLPLSARFLQRSADLLRLHSGTLARLRDTLAGLGLERLHERLATSASEAAKAASKLWEELESKDAGEMVKDAKAAVDALTDPKLESMLQAGVARLNKLACKAEGFDGVWVGKDDGQPRSAIKDAMITWHWGEVSELEIWGVSEVSTMLEGELFSAELIGPRELKWTDGDVWVHSAAAQGSLTPASDEAEPAEMVNEVAEHMRSRVAQGLSDLRNIVRAKGFDGDIEEVLGALSNAAAGDAELQRIVQEARQHREALDDLRGQVMKSKTGELLQEARSRFDQKLAALRDTEISPQLERMQARSQRLLVRLSTDRQVKSKATQIFSATQKRLTERLFGQNGGGDIEGWVAFVKKRIVERLSVHRAMLVECLGDNALGLQQADFRRLVSSFWDPKALEAQLEESLVAALQLSGMEVNAAELLDRFESSASVVGLPLVQRTYRGLLTTLSELDIEVPPPIQKLIEAHAAGRTQDIATWQAAVISSLDDEQVVKNTTELMKKGEQVLDKLSDFKKNKTVMEIMEHLEKQDLEREFVETFRGLDAEKLVGTADLALTDAAARERLVSELKDTCLDFILRVLPAIRIEKLTGNDNGCDWEINDITFSNFAFRKENVHVVLGAPGSTDEDLMRVNAWDISANFKELKVAVNQTHFPFMSATGIADARATRMSVSLAFRLQACRPELKAACATTEGASPAREGNAAAPAFGGPLRSTVSAAAGAAGAAGAGVVVDTFSLDGQAAVATGGGSAARQSSNLVPQLVVSSRAVHMESMELCVRESNYAMIVNALSYLFANVLKDYACEKVSKQLDKHTDALVEALNGLLGQAAPLLARLGWQLPVATPAAKAAAAVDPLGSVARGADALVGTLVNEDDDDEDDDRDESLLLLDWPDPGRAFAVRF